MVTQTVSTHGIQNKNLTSRILCMPYSVMCCMHLPATFSAADERTAAQEHTARSAAESTLSLLSL